MWHEARRVEKQLRGMMVNFKRRAERRRAFYSRMKQDPVQLLRVYGHKSKIHIDPQVAAAAEHRTVMMPWQGHADNMIDRFDGRAHLDIINESPEEEVAGPLMETDPEQNRLNYERYRTLVMINHSEASEDEYLQQLEVEEMFPKKDENKDKKEKSVAKASIGYTYEDSSVAPGAAEGEDSNNSDSSDSDSDDESIPSDIDVTVNVDDLTKQEVQEIDSQAMNYGMAPAQYCRKLKVDKVEAEEQKRIKEEEDERALMGGRRSRKDRRSMRDRQRNQCVQNSPPSYARRSSPTYEPYGSKSSSSSSRSCSPEASGQVEFITEFGASKTGPSTKPIHSGDSRTHSSSSRDKDHSKPKQTEHQSRRRRSRDRERSRRSRSRDHRRSGDRSRSRSRDHRRSGDRSRSRSRESRRGRSSSRGRSRSRDRNRSRDRSRSRDRHRQRSRSRTRSYHEERDERDERDRSGHRDQSHETRVSERAKDTAKASAKLTGMSKAKQTADSKDKTKLTPQERMKKRMQMMLNKQLKSDRKDDRNKRDVKEQQRLDREDDLRLMQRKWRDKSRRSPSPRSWSSHRRSRSRSPSRSRRRSDSTPSPPKTVPVVDYEEQTRRDEVIHFVYE